MLSMQVTGLDELERQLIALGEKAGTKVLRDAGRAALEIVEQDMKEHAGYDESAKGPHMRDSIKIRPQPAPKAMQSSCFASDPVSSTLSRRWLRSSAQ